MQRRNDGINNKRAVLSKKIGAIFSTACANPMITSMGFGFRFPANEERESNQERSISLKKTHPLNDKSLKQSREWKPSNANSSSLSTLKATGLKKWKSSVKKVVKMKLRMKIMGNLWREKEKGNEMELCKKRILMGERCKALNISGVLHYDKQGIILPED